MPALVISQPPGGSTPYDITNGSNGTFSPPGPPAVTWAKQINNGSLQYFDGPGSGTWAVGLTTTDCPTSGASYTLVIYAWDQNGQAYRQAVSFVRA
jgi:hypothetical protein